MLLVGKNATERRAFEAALVTTHEIRVRVKLLLLSTGKEVSDLSGRLVDGQVNIDGTAEVTRSADLTISDPDHVLHLDARGAGDGALYADRLISITYGVYGGSLTRWIDVPIFRGPIVGMARDGDVITLSCLGLEHLAKAQAWHPMSFKKGANTVSVIRAILRERAGESSFAFPTGGYRLPDVLAIGRLDSPWAVASKLAGSINRQLYYDGKGVCRLRPRPKTSVWAFKAGNGGTVLTTPDLTYDLTAISNLVWVRGRTAKGKPQITATEIAPRSHPLSPFSLGRNNVGRYLVTEISDDKIRTTKAAKERAEDALATMLREGVEISFDALPVPHLDPLDIATVTTPDTTVTFSLKQFSIPLVHSGVMSVGSNKRVVPNRKAVRRR